MTLAPIPPRILDWQACLHKTATGTVIPNVANAVVALERHPQLQNVVALNRFTERVECHGWVDGTFGRTFPHNWTDRHDTALLIFLQSEVGLSRLSLQAVNLAVEAVASKNAHDPLTDFLAGCYWDGTARLDTLLNNYFGVEPTKFSTFAGQAWMVQCVARAYEPGCQADATLILEGNQGAGKSTALRLLAGDEFFTDHIDGLFQKDASMQTMGRWICELSELEGFSKSEASTIKAFLTRRIDHFRPPYGKHVIDAPRRCSFVGTVNGDHYLKDETGNRRFWPFKVGGIDLDAIARDRELLWGEAVELYRSKTPWWITSEDVLTEAREAQAARVQQDSWHDAIERWLADPKPAYDDGCPIEPFTSSPGDTTVEEVLIHCLRVPRERHSQLLQNRAAAALRNLGLVRRQIRVTSDGAPVTTRGTGVTTLTTRRQWRYCETEVADRA